MAYGGKNDVIIYDVTWPWKVNVVTRIIFECISPISNTALDADYRRLLYWASTRNFLKNSKYKCKQETQLKLVVAHCTKPEVVI